MLQKLNEQSTVVKIIVMLVVAALLGGGGYYFLAMPIQDSNKVLKTQLDAKTAENAQLKQFENKLPDLERQIVQLRAQMEFQKQIVPDEKSADNFIILLQEQASNSNINIRKIEAKAVASREFYTEVPFAIQVDGPYYGMVNFFEKLGGQTRIVNVDGIQMKGTTSKGGNSPYPIGPNDSVTVTATAKTFFSKEITTAPAATPAKPATPAKK
jgi:type IV pilus assembly protein PilO